MHLIAFLDSDWAHDVDGRKSTMGIFIKLGDAMITWKNKLQPIVATSTTEVEYRSMSEATKDISWTRAVLNNLKMEVITTPTPLFCNNLSTAN